MTLRALALLSVLVAPACVCPPLPSPHLVARTYIEADYDRVWRAFTTAEGYQAWYSTPCRVFGTEPGAECVWAVGERVTYRGELRSIEPGVGLAHTFRFVGFGFEETTLVDIEIVQQGDVVYVCVQHDCSKAPETRALITEVGWSKSLARLKSLLERGTPMPWPEGVAGQQAR